MGSAISHKGVIERVEGDRAFVRITQQSACSGCHARAVCSASERKDKVIEVPTGGQPFTPNEEVEICGQSSVGLRAVWWAFVLPLIGLVAVVMAGSASGWTETWCGVASLAWLVVYVGVLYLLRDKFKREFVFFLKKLNTVS